MNLQLPDDAHNARWVANVRPSDWRNPTPAGRYNMVVLGAGSAGLVCAAGVAGLGGKVAVIEKQMLGGDCLNTGCVPSRAPLRPAHFIGGQTLRFSKAVIATGSRAAVPPIPGLQETGFITNESVFNLTELPRRLAIIGGGPIGCEMAQAFQNLGSQVTVLSHAPGIRGRDDVDAARVIQRALETDGVQFRLGVEPARVERLNGEVVVHWEDKSQSQRQSLGADAVLVATGRAPQVEGLDLERAGVAYTRRGVTVDDHMRTTSSRIYAAGDVAYKYQFTHTADATARIAVQNALFFGRRRASDLNVPWCTYTDPELAQVGLTEAEARARGVAVTLFDFPNADLDRAVTDGETEGFIKVLVKAGSDKIVGATIVGRRAGDMISEVTVAMAGKVGLAQLTTLIHPYPTRSEGLKKVTDAYNRSRLTPRVKSLFVKFLAWRR